MVRSGVAPPTSPVTIALRAVETPRFCRTASTLLACAKMVLVVARPDLLPSLGLVPVIPIATQNRDLSHEVVLEEPVAPAHSSALCGAHCGV